MTALLSVIMQIRKMDTLTPPWRILKDILWHWVDIQGHPTLRTPKLTISQPMHGLKLPIIHIMIREF